MDTFLRIATAVIAKADREHPADGVLRLELKQAKGLSHEEGRAISQAVFAYFRWRGWLNWKEPVARQVSHALELDRAFKENPGSMADETLRTAIPKWIEEQVEVSPEWLRSLQTEPALWLRARLGRGKELALILGAARRASAELPDAVIYEGEEDLFRTKEFHTGEFELQDISSQIVGLACDPQPGETWWDACAGEGGKTLHLGELMRGRGLVWASDRAAWRLQKLKRRAARARLFNYRAALWDGGKKLPTKGKFDGILVDAPCSGVGTWQRNPHARWTVTPQDVEELGGVQKRLLSNVVPALKPGGKLVYSVCTLTRAETVEVAEAITRQFPELKPLPLKNPLEPESVADGLLWLWPQTVSGNGMFIRGWRKEG